MNINSTHLINTTKLQIYKYNYYELLLLLCTVQLKLKYLTAAFN